MIAETVSIAPIASKPSFHKYHTKNNDCKWHRNKLYASRVFLELTLYTSVRSALYSLFRCPPLPITRLSIFIFALWLVTAALCAAAAVHQEHFTASHNPTYTYRVTLNTGATLSVNPSQPKIIENKTRVFYQQI